MNITYQTKRWEINHPFWLTILRVILGLCLAIRGIYFLNNMTMLHNVIESSSLNVLDLTTALAMLITWVHILGGTFIILGLLTPIAVWAQLPIVLGAIIFINTRTGIFATNSDLLFSIIVLVLLVLFAFKGSGRISMDSYLKKYLL